MQPSETGLGPSPVIPCYLKFFRGKDSPSFAAVGCMPQVSRCILPIISDTRGLANQRKVRLINRVDVSR